jgi:hypothetical protein
MMVRFFFFLGSFSEFSPPVPASSAIVFVRLGLLLGRGDSCSSKSSRRDDGSWCDDGSMFLAVGSNSVSFCFVVFLQIYVKGLNDWCLLSPVACRLILSVLGKVSKCHDQLYHLIARRAKYYAL